MTHVNVNITSKILEPRSSHVDWLHFKTRSYNKWHKRYFKTQKAALFVGNLEISSIAILQWEKTVTCYNRFSTTETMVNNAHSLIKKIIFMCLFKDILSRPAEEFGNVESLETLWAEKAFEHAEIYFNVSQAACLLK